MENTWRNCADCGQRYKGVLPICADCQCFEIDIGPMNWNLFQRQRATLIELVHDERMSSVEQEHLQGVLNLTDHIIDVAKARGRSVPDLNDVVLDRLAEID